MTSPEITDAAGPRPWTVETNLPYGEQPRIYDASGRLVAVVGNAEIDRQDEWEGNAELIVATVNALAAGVAPGVKVKALEWSFEPPYHVARVLKGHYSIEKWEDKARFDLKGTFVSLTGAFTTLGDAKAHAQADYEARILSALEPAPSALVSAAKAERERAEQAASNVTSETFRYYLAEAENGLCRIPRRVVDDMWFSYMRIVAAREAAEAEAARLREALVDAAAHLRGAASAYREHAARHRSVGRAKPDPFFTTRASDFEKAADRAALGAGQ